MVQITPRQCDRDQTTTLRAFSSLTPRDSDAVRATVRMTGNHYSVEDLDDYDGYRSILLTPLHRAAACGYLVAGRVGAIELAALDGDDMVPLGRFPSIGAAMLSLRPALEREADINPQRDAAQRLIDRHGSDADLHAALRADAAIDERWRVVIRAIDRRDDI